MINEGRYKTDVGLQRRRFSLIEIYMKIIDEAFDFKNINSYKLIANSEGWEFNAEIAGDIVPVYIYFERSDSSRFKSSPKMQPMIDNSVIAYNFGFEIGSDRRSDQYSKTNFKDYIKIIATVGNALKELIKKYHPELVVFFSESKYGGIKVDPQKDDIYFSALDRNKPDGYEIDKIRDSVDGKIGLMLYRKNK